MLFITDLHLAPRWGCVEIYRNSIHTIYNSAVPSDTLFIVGICDIFYNATGSFCYYANGMGPCGVPHWQQFRLGIDVVSQTDNPEIPTQMQQTDMTRRIVAFRNFAQRS